MEILFWMLFTIFWFVVGIWLYTIINEKTRNNRTYLYPMTVLEILALIMVIITLVAKW